MNNKNYYIGALVNPNKYDLTVMLTIHTNVIQAEKDGILISRFQSLQGRKSDSLCTALLLLLLLIQARPLPIPSHFLINRKESFN